MTVGRHSVQEVEEHPEVGLDEGPQHVELLVRAALQVRLLQAQRRRLRRLRVHGQVLGVAQAQPGQFLHLPS